jgi:pyrroloquinoline quinone biosynthesis protein D
MSSRPRVARGFRLQWEEVQDSWVLLYPEGMVKLNASAGEILRRCDGERTVQAIVGELEEAFDTTGLADDVAAFLEIAARQRWVEASGEGNFP